MEATEVVEKIEIEIESKSPKVSEEREGTEDTETQSSFDNFMYSTTWTGDNKKIPILIEDG